jgi:O-antigen/teichoic acid export membrane protein
LPFRLPLPLRKEHRRGFAWSFVDQGLSSATNLGLSVLAGRLLGPSGLGTVSLAFAAYLIALVLQRSLVTAILLAFTSALDSEQRARTAGIGLTLSLLAGVTTTTLALLLGSVLPGFGHTGLFLVAPWVVVLLLQDFWRSLLFREKRASAAAANDGAWFVTMAAALPVALVLKTEWAVITVWGLGALAGAILGFLQTRVSPSRIRAAWSWWHKEAWSFARWNASAAMIVNLGGTAGRFVLAAIVGVRSLGGFRAVESLFAPLSVIGPALNLPGLPAVARAYAVGFRRGRDMAITISGIAVAAALLFFAFLFLGGWRLLPFLFGASFEQYRELLLPIALSQIFSAAGIGLGLLITVQRRGRFLLFSRLVAVSIGIGIMAVGAMTYGVIGAAWASAISTLILAVTVAVGALREPKRVEAVVPVTDADLTTETVVD